MRNITFAPTVHPEFLSFVQSFKRALLARNLSQRTIDTYLESLRSLADFLCETGMPQDVTVISREHIEAFLQRELDIHKPSTALTRYKSLNVFFHWLIEEGEIADVSGSPMKRIKSPKVPDNPPEVLTEEQLRAILKTCSGKEFADRRDMAILSLLIDTGVRREELTNITVDAINFDLNIIYIPKGKGGSGRNIVFGRKTAQALDRYLRTRSHHKDKDLPYLWLGTKGRLTRDGLYKAVVRRCEQADIKDAYVHLFRHSFAHHWLLSGSEIDLQRLGGWSSMSVMRKYGSSAADSRARDHFRDNSPRDKI